MFHICGCLCSQFKLLTIYENFGPSMSFSEWPQATADGELQWEFVLCSRSLHLQSDQRACMCIYVCVLVF